MVVFISESVIGLLSYVYQDRLGPDLEATLTQSFISSYGLDHDRTPAADNIQLKVRTSQHRPGYPDSVVVAPVLRQ